MAYIVWKEISFAAAHWIPNHPGKCKNLHGHNYRVRVSLSAEELDELGMVIDFADLKVRMNEEVGRFDHRVLNELPPFDTINPTSELLSEHIYRALASKIDDGRVRVLRVEVLENDVSCATFEP